MKFFWPAEGGPGVLFREKKDKGIIQQRIDHYIRIDQAHQNRG
jgi:hypothetical protein